MNTSGEVADLMAKEAIQMTESAVKLTALGVKNLAAIVMALANDDGKTEGVAKLKQMLKTGKQLCIMQIKEADLKKFNAEAKNYGIMYRPVADKTNDNGLCDVIAFQDDIPRLNYIMEKLGYSATEHEIEPEAPEQAEAPPDKGKDENSKNRPSRAERTNENPHGNKSISFEDTAKTDSGIKPSVRKKIEDIKADLEEKKKPAPEKEKAIQHKQPQQKKRKKKNRKGRE
ncbi:PcfB family protein [Ructibacterium gallinarum]|uniref:PcfB family protein n=1 Tax=Ructibacterium gallinarum TaxID=2779355 RepID=A0A9D5M001_9FIRM|nr:PcfB family protein [Ructibacterium gallinarum]MBE5041178.1 PcfB family protein [Ructibacterium gallinarum]